MPLSAEDRVAAFIADGAAHSVVPTMIDGHAVLLAFEMDAQEHARRVERRLGPVRSRGLLHALWALPTGLPWPASGIDPLDATTLRVHGAGFVSLNSGSLTRLYQPAGRVRALGLVSKRLAQAVSAASQFPPIFRRYAIARKSGATDPAAATAAHAVGVGAAVTSQDGFRILARAEPPRIGVPGVYRWWLAEVAYRSWLQTNVH